MPTHGLNKKEKKNNSCNSFYAFGGGGGANIPHTHTHTWRTMDKTKLQKRTPNLTVVLVENLDDEEYALFCLLEQ